MWPVPYGISPVTSPFQQREGKCLLDRHFPGLKIICMSHSDPAQLRDNEGESEKGVQFLSTVCYLISLMLQHTWPFSPSSLFSKRTKVLLKRLGKLLPLSDYIITFKTQLWVPFPFRAMPFWCMKACNPPINSIRGAFCTCLWALRVNEHWSLLADGDVILYSMWAPKTWVLSTMHRLMACTVTGRELQEPHRTGITQIAVTQAPH